MGDRMSEKAAEVVGFVDRKTSKFEGINVTYFNYLLNWGSS